VQGSFLLAATPNGSSGASQAAGHTGGKATVTLTIDEIPAHSHKTGISGTEAMPFSYGSDSARVLFDQYSGVSTGDAGGGGPHENMPPYLAVYM
jgi:microcystin-dependent protein